MLMSKLKTATMMMLFAVVAMSALVFSITSMAGEPNRGEPAPPPKANKMEGTDQEKIQGTWKMTYAEVNGQPLSPEQIGNLKLVFKGDKHTLYKGDQVEAIGGHRLDPNKKVKAIDISEDEGPNKGKSNRGIYLLEDDLFIVCYNTPEMDRPTAFTSKADSTIHLFIYKRVAP